MLHYAGIALQPIMLFIMLAYIFDAGRSVAIVQAPQFILYVEQPSKKYSSGMQQGSPLSLKFFV